MGVSVPVFWVGLLLIQYVGGAGLLPFQGRDGPIWTPTGCLSIILPAITLGAVFVGPVARMTRTSLLETLGADYVRTARAKGASDWRVMIRHALRNALIPVVTLIGLQIGFLLGGAVVTETMFAWPGVGRMAVGAITSSDFPLAQGAILMLAVGFMVINLVVDVLYAYLDPRIARHMTRSRIRRPAAAADADASAPSRVRRKNAIWRRMLRDPPAAARTAIFLVPASCWQRSSRRGSRPFDPYANNMRLRFCPPWARAAPALLLLGTDNQGRDMVSRMLFGLRSTLAMGVHRRARSAAASAP